MDTTITTPIDCACVIHGDVYTWSYVERLYNMLNRHISVGVRLHVYTEADRPVPAHMIKHILDDWGSLGPRKAWWYKMQMFNSAYHRGPLLYFDLDTVIVDNIDWIWTLPTTHFWAVRDFKHLWKPSHCGINSSVMWWDTQKFDRVWQQFQSQGRDQLMRRYPGDQDYLNISITETERRFFEQNCIKSWRWQSLDGGYDFKNRCHKTPNSGTHFDSKTSVLIFHGRPKPSETTDPVILEHWR